MSRDVLRRGAIEIASRYRSKELDPVEVVEAHIQRIKQVNPMLNAVVADRFEQAREEATLKEQLKEEVETLKLSLEAAKEEAAAAARKLKLRRLEVSVENAAGETARARRALEVAEAAEEAARLKLAAERAAQSL